MSLFSRVSDIINANVSDMLDRAEDPEKMVKMLIFEMEEQIAIATGRSCQSNRRREEAGGEPA